MAFAEIIGADQALGQLEEASRYRQIATAKARRNPCIKAQADFYYLRAVREVRLGARLDGSMDDLDQAVLGTTGSTEALTRYRQLARQVGEQASAEQSGGPVIDIEATTKDGNSVQRALVGRVSDRPMLVRANFLSGEALGIRAPQQRASLKMEAQRVKRYTHRDGDWHVSAAHGDNVWMEMATIELDESLNRSFDPEQDYTVKDRVGQGKLLIGQEAIRASQLFEPDLQDILGLYLASAA